MSCCSFYAYSPFQLTLFCPCSFLYFGSKVPPCDKVKTFPANKCADAICSHTAFSNLATLMKMVMIVLHLKKHVIATYFHDVLFGQFQKILCSELVGYFLSFKFIIVVIVIRCCHHLLLLSSSLSLLPGFTVSSSSSSSIKKVVTCLVLLF